MQKWTIKARLKAACLPIEGKMSFVPPRNYNPGDPLRRHSGDGYRDRFGNGWKKGPARSYDRRDNFK